MTGICRGSHASQEYLEIAKTMFNAVGRTVVDENMDAVTGLSARTGVRVYHSGTAGGSRGEGGLPRDVSTLLAAQTMKGAASVVLETGDHPHC